MRSIQLLVGRGTEVICVRSYEDEIFGRYDLILLTSNFSSDPTKKSHIRKFQTRVDGLHFTP